MGLPKNQNSYINYQKIKINRKNQFKKNLIKPNKNTQKTKTLCKPKNLNNNSQNKKS